jgi:Na+/H+ antiporter NhaD/arsenite permease-like protein
MLHLTSKYRLNPVPFIIMLVFATNIGSAASSIGNPIGVMIAFNAGFSFLEFLRWSAPVALVVNVVTYFICRWWYSESFKAFAEAVEREHAAVVEARQAAEARSRRSQPALVAAAASVGGEPAEWTQGNGEESNEAELPPPPSHHHEHHVFQPERLWLSWVVFGATILLLVTHGWTERHLGHLVGQRDGLPEGTMMMGAALLMGAVVLVLQGKRARELVERRVDWWTLSFFMMLFASVGTLEHTGVTRLIADRLIHATGGNVTAIVHIVGWATGWLSAFLDNVLAVATFMPVVHDIRAAAAPQPVTASIYWMMLFGGTFMGNMTLIGSTANIIALGVLEKRGHGTIRFWEWFKIGFIVSIASMLVAATLLQLQSHWVPNLPPPTAAVKVGH